MAPTEEQIAQFEAQGAEPVEIPEAGEGFVAYVRPFSYAEFRTMLNDGAKPCDEGQNARIAAMHRAVVYPTRAEMNRAYAVFPGTLGRVVGAVERFAGAHEEVWYRFDAGVDDELLAELGIPLETASDLRAAYPLPGQLWICHVEPLHIVLVVRRPTATVTTRMLERARTAYFDAALEATTDSIVWPAPDVVAPLLRELPAIASNIVFDKLLKTTKGEASASKKGFMPKGRKSGA